VPVTAWDITSHAPEFRYLKAGRQLGAQLSSTSPDFMCLRASRTTTVLIASNPISLYYIYIHGQPTKSCFVAHHPKMFDRDLAIRHFQPPLTFVDEVAKEPTQKGSPPRSKGCLTALPCPKDMIHRCVGRNW
jgi:hypothetical protein